jgi:hypothetical protein
LVRRDRGNRNLQKENRCEDSDRDNGAGPLGNLGRDLPMILAVLAFVGFNFWLWSLPLRQVQLFFISLPIGIGAMSALFWHVRRD